MEQNGMPPIGGNDKDVPVKRVYLNRKPQRRMFLSLSQEQARIYFSRTNNEAKTLLVFMAVLNACRATKKRSLVFTPRWYTNFGLSAKAALRSLLRLEDRGLITLNRQRGRSPEVTLSDQVEPEIRNPASQTIQTSFTEI